MPDESILVDTNVLLTATTPSRPFHREALAVLNEWPTQGARLCAPGQVLREYLVVATRPAENNGLALEPAQALANVSTLRKRLRLLEETARVSERLLQLVQEFGCRSKQIHDANLVAAALTHDVGRIVTANARDFRRFESHVEILDLATTTRPSGSPGRH